MNYNPQKVKKFHEYTLSDYNGSLRSEKIVEPKLVKKSDGSFTQIGIRPVLEDGLLIEEGFSEYLPGAGRMVAIGEADFLINNLLENKEIKRVETTLKEFLDFPLRHAEFAKATILLSTKFYVPFFTKLMNRIDYKQGSTILDYGNNIVSIPQSVLNNKIIILDPRAILWEKQLFVDKETGQEGTLDIQIKPAEEFGKVDITIRSVNKIRDINPNWIKILEVKDG